MTMSDPLSFTHRYVPAKVPGQHALLLLHGTGGDENDLLPLGQSLAPGAALISPRGKVLERGMPRFFSRVAEGIFDLAEVRRRSLDLATFVEAARRTYDVPAPIAVGYSNGANIAAAMMLMRPGILAGAILLRAMEVLDDHAAGLDGTPVLMVSGASDPIVTLDIAQSLAVQLREGGATIDHRVLPTGHQLIQEDLVIAKAWLEQQNQDRA
jgi:phospholipase/carboxylesterase